MDAIYKLLFNSEVLESIFNVLGLFDTSLDLTILHIPSNVAPSSITTIAVIRFPLSMQFFSKVVLPETLTSPSTFPLIKQSCDSMFPLMCELFAVRTVPEAATFPFTFP